MPRRIKFGEIKTRMLDITLFVFSTIMCVIGFGFMIYVAVAFPEFHFVPFLEFLIVFIMGLLGYRAWNKETAI